ncbi:MAG: hypothetical protein JO020_12820 [Chloroflexi bacterium]|nr:hypothetical protein [Chloroflexota bacterium]
MPTFQELAAGNPKVSATVDVQSLAGSADDVPVTITRYGANDILRLVEQPGLTVRGMHTSVRQ